MNIVVCVKEILDSTDVKFDAQTGRLVRDGQPGTINALDEYAVEEALRLKEAQGGTVTVLSMGPAKAEAAWRHAIAMGADKAIHVTDEALAGGDTVASAYALARALARKGDFDLVLCGSETLDGNTAYIGSAIAQNLGLPCVTFVQKIEQIGDGKAVVQRMMEAGYDRVETALPAVLTVVKAINEPRISSLKGKMRAKKEAAEVVKAADLPGASADRLGAAGSTSRVTRTFPPQARPKGALFEGEPDAIADQLFNALKG